MPRQFLAKRTVLGVGALLGEDDALIPDRCQTHARLAFPDRFRACPLMLGAFVSSSPLGLALELGTLGSRNGDLARTARTDIWDSITD